MKRLLVIAAISCSIMAGGVASAKEMAPPEIPPSKALPLPTSSDQCKQDGWQTYGVFKNQGDCVSFVQTDGNNQPAG